MTAEHALHFWFDEQGVHRAGVWPIAWDDSMAWADVVRVCLEMEDFLGVNSLYVFTRQRTESYVFPLDTDEGQALLNELIRRKLFDAELAIEAASGEGFYCWPEGIG